MFARQALHHRAAPLTSQQYCLKVIKNTINPFTSDQCIWCCVSCAFFFSQHSKADFGSTLQALTFLALKIFIERKVKGYIILKIMEI